ncbi:FHDC1 [Cordylochernes scorpioides]|uniref:FHDC1 n=1 Tax=Cordylochernes scorpioides TaxID=51811 RepID=A0ABY6LEZ4_9ARAC|nr:FHDC1 [Cordylochernes scorpioides]
MNEVTEVPQETSAATPSQVNEENIDQDGLWTKVTHAKKPRIPPVIAENVTDWKLLCQELKDLCTDKFQCTISGNKHIIKAKNISDFKKIREYVQKNNGGYSYRLQEEKPLKVVLKGVTTAYKTEDIAIKLETMGFAETSVKRLHRQSTKRPMNLVLKIAVESFRTTNRVTQCFNCQGFGHGQLNCFLKPKCVKCAEEHHSKDCPRKSRQLPPKCANCEEAHTANYRRCPKFPRVISNSQDTLLSRVTNWVHFQQDLISTTPPRLPLKTEVDIDSAVEILNEKINNSYSKNTIVSSSKLIKNPKTKALIREKKIKLGKDGNQPWIQLIELLTSIFKESFPRWDLQCCIIPVLLPKTWKHAIIITIPKKSPVKSPEDLRPISLLSTIGLVVELVLCNEDGGVRSSTMVGGLDYRKGCLSPSWTGLWSSQPPSDMWLDHQEGVSEKGISVSGSVLPRLKVASGSILTPHNHQRFVAYMDNELMADKELSEDDLVNLVCESESDKSDEEELVPVTFTAKVIREGLALGRKLVIILCKMTQTIFERDDEQLKCKLLQEFHTYKFDKNVDLVANISNLRNLAFKLNNLKQNFDDNIVISKILTILPEDYNYFCTAWESIGKDEKTIENLISRLTTEEIRRNRQSQPEDRVAMNATKQKVCFTCNKPGHISKNCTQRKFCKFCKKTNHEEKDCFFKNNSKPAAKVNKEQCRICKKFNHKEKDCYFRNKEKQPPIAFIAEQREEYDKRSSVTFIVDSGSTCHMINEEKLLDHQKKCDVNINVAKKEEGMRAKTSGQFKGRQCNLNEVIFVPELSKNLLSVSSIVNNRGEVHFKGDKVTILKDGKKVLEGDQLENGLYAVNIEQHFSKKNDSNLTLPSENKTQEWHRKLGHIGMQNLRKLESLVDGMELNKLEKQENDVCEICIMAKQTRKSFGNERSRATRPLEIVHTDLCGPIEPLTHDNKKYIMTFLDDYTHFCYVYLLSNKYEAKEYIKEYVNEVERFLNAKVSKLRCDNGGEYANTQVKEWCKMKGIILDFTVPYTPQLNGKAERLNRTLIEKTRALLLDSKLNKEMWGEATRVAAYLINRSPSNTVQTTPAQMWYGRNPNLSNVKLFGSEVYVKKLGNLKKLDSKSEKYSLIGYSGNGYRLWDMQKRRIIIARDVVFTGKLTNELSSVIQPRYREDLDSEIEESQDTKLELDTHDKPQNSTNSKYMLRNRENINRPERLKDYEVLNSVSEEIGLLTYNEAVTGVDKENWIKAIQEEKD